MTKIRKDNFLQRNNLYTKLERKNVENQWYTRNDVVKSVPHIEGREDYELIGLCK